MQQVESFEQVQSLITEIRTLRKGFITNFYPDSFKHGVWIKNNDLFYEHINDTLFLIRKSANFANVFYVSVSIEALKASLSAFLHNTQNKTLIIEVVGRKEQCLPIVDVFKEQGLVMATSLVRMVRKTEIIERDETFDKVFYANEEQAREVHRLLHLFFDEKSEQIPYLEELIEYSKMGHILVYLDNNRVIGFMVYEKNPTTLHWRYWFVHPDYRDRHIGSILFRRLFFEANDTKRQILWVIETNTNAKKREEHYGFSEENMYDYVMQYN